MPEPLSPEYQFVWDELERDGEPLTRVRVNTKQYSGKKLELAKMWLDWKIQGREEIEARRIDALNRRDLRADQLRQNIIIIISVIAAAATIIAAIVGFIAWQYPKTPSDTKASVPKVESPQKP